VATTLAPNGGCTSNSNVVAQTCTIPCSKGDGARSCDGTCVSGQCDIRAALNGGGLMWVAVTFVVTPAQSLVDVTIFASKLAQSVSSLVGLQLQSIAIVRENSKNQTSHVFTIKVSALSATGFSSTQTFSSSAEFIAAVRAEYKILASSADFEVTVSSITTSKDGLNAGAQHSVTLGLLAAAAFAALA